MAPLNKIAVLLSAFLLFFLSASSQNRDILVNYPDRYRLRLPEEWMKPKIIRAVTDILPKTIDELKDRDFCIAGKAAYYVFLIVDSFSINQASYSFHAALRTYDSLGKLIADLRLISPEEIFNLQRPITIGPTNYYSTAEYVYSPAPDQYGNFQRTENNSPPPPVWNENFSQFTSIEIDILSICKKKIFEIRKLLRGFNRE